MSVTTLLNGFIHSANILTNYNILYSYPSTFGLPSPFCVKEDLFLKEIFFYGKHDQVFAVITPTVKMASLAGSSLRGGIFRKFGVPCLMLNYEEKKMGDLATKGKDLACKKRCAKSVITFKPFNHLVFHLRLFNNLQGKLFEKSNESGSNELYLFILP